MGDNIKIAVDAMGGKDAPKKILDAIFSFLSSKKNIFIEIHGDEEVLKKFIKNYKGKTENYKIVHCSEVILDTESPLKAAKQKNSSMYSAINSVKLKNSDIALSAGNTGALLVLSRLNLNMVNGIDKPALAALWPNENDVNIVLDLGANIECTEKNLIDFSIMGDALHKSLFSGTNSNVALLNVGSEEIKGNEILKKTSEQLKKMNLEKENFSYIGFIEGNEIMSGRANVIVTDGFTGNIALKTAEGTADFITKQLKHSLKENIFSKIGSLFLYKSLKSFKNKLDPRKYNGAIFVGLTAPIVKSHGSTDSLGFEYSLNTCAKIIENNLINKIEANIKNTIE